MYDRMRDFIEKHSLLYSSQYGFRQAGSTQHDILDMVETIQTNMVCPSYCVYTVTLEDDIALYRNPLWGAGVIYVPSLDFKYDASDWQKLTF